MTTPDPVGFPARWYDLATEAIADRLTELDHAGKPVWPSDLALHALLACLDGCRIEDRYEVIHRGHVVSATDSRARALNLARSTPTATVRRRERVVLPPERIDTTPPKETTDV